MRFEIPAEWGRDSVSRFIDGAYQNCVATIMNYKDTPVIKALVELDDLFACAIKINYGQDERLIPNFVGRCHSAYLGGVLSSTSGQVVEAYMVMRGALENAMYGLFIHDDPDNAGIPERTKVWINREKSEETKDQCRRMFKYVKVRDNLLKHNQGLGQEASNLYNRTIDYGAHPNFQGHATTSSVNKGGGSIIYLMPNTPPCKLCIQTNVEVGVCCLRIFELMLSARFSEAGITQRLNKINSGIKRPQ